MRQTPLVRIAAELRQIAAERDVAKRRALEAERRRDEALAELERWRPLLADLSARLARLEQAAQAVDEAGSCGS